MIGRTILARRASRMLAIQRLSQAVAAWYGLDARSVREDAARFGGEWRLADLPWETHKAVADYLCGRLLLPERVPGPRVMGSKSAS